MDNISNDKDFIAIDEALNDFSINKNERASVVCPHCNAYIHVYEHTSWTDVRCETNNCLSDILKGL